jgi:hypothetical protein
VCAAWLLVSISRGKKRELRQTAAAKTTVGGECSELRNGSAVSVGDIR